MSSVSVSLSLSFAGILQIFVFRNGFHHRAAAAVAVDSINSFTFIELTLSLFDATNMMSLAISLMENPMKTLCSKQKTMSK
jgi:hypothetical protein